MKQYQFKIIFVVFAFASAQVKGQVGNDPAATTPDAARKGYVALTAGVAIPASEDMSFYSPGFQMNVVQVGYLFINWLGVTGSAGLSRNMGSGGGDGGMAVGSLMIGPMISIPAKKFNVDFRPQIGYALSKPIRSDPFQQATAVSFSIGANLRYHPSDKVSLLFGIDYFSTSPEFDTGGVGGFYHQVNSTLNLSAGLAVRVR